MKRKYYVTQNLNEILFKVFVDVLVNKATEFPAIPEVRSDHLLLPRKISSAFR